MEKITTIGVDLAKNVFQIHAINGEGKALVRRQLRRGDVLRFFARTPRCLVGMEACATAHYWGRELSKLGHEVRLMPPAYVKPYVKRGKTDAADAEAICEAVTRPTMRFVPIKSEAIQAVLMQHKTRDLLVRQRTMLINALRGHLAEFGFVAPRGPRGVKEALNVLSQKEEDFPALARDAFGLLTRQLETLEAEIASTEKAIIAWCKDDDQARRLLTIPGIGPITASAITAAVPDASLFRSGRQFAAWLGLTPKPHSSGGKDKLGRISKQGDSYIRRLLVIGATAVLRRARQDHPARPWVAGLLERKPARLVSVALANKTARIAWAVLARGEVYRAPATAN